MSTFLEGSLSKDFINGKLLEAQVENIKEQLEKISNCESIESILAEEFCESERLLSQSNLEKDDLLTLIEISRRIHAGICKFAYQHRKEIGEHNFEALKTKSLFFSSVAKLLKAILSPTSAIKPHDSLKNLRNWQELLETYAEVIDNSKDIAPEFRIQIRGMCDEVLSATEKAYFDSPKKEKHRKLIRNCASYILKKVEEQRFIVGGMSREKLLEETKSRLHLLDLLSPSSNEEAKEQMETRQELFKALGE